MHLGDENGALYEDLVEKEKVAVSMGADYDARKYGGVLQVRAVLSPTGTHEAAEKRIEEAIAALQAEPLSERGDGRPAPPLPGPGAGCRRERHAASVS